MPLFFQGKCECQKKETADPASCALRGKSMKGQAPIRKRKLIPKAVKYRRPVPELERSNTDSLTEESSSSLSSSDSNSESESESGAQQSNPAIKSDSEYVAAAYGTTWFIAVADSQELTTGVATTYNLLALSCQPLGQTDFYVPNGGDNWETLKADIICKVQPLKAKPGRRSRYKVFSDAKDWARVKERWILYPDDHIAADL